MHPDYRNRKKMVMNDFSIRIKKYGYTYILTTEASREVVSKAIDFLVQISNGDSVTATNLVKLLEDYGYRSSFESNHPSPDFEL